MARTSTRQALLEGSELVSEFQNVIEVSVDAPSFPDTTITHEYDLFDADEFFDEFLV